MNRIRATVASAEQSTRPLPFMLRGTPHTVTVMAATVIRDAAIIVSPRELRIEVSGSPAQVLQLQINALVRLRRPPGTDLRVSAAVHPHREARILFGAVSETCTTCGNIATGKRGSQMARRRGKGEGNVQQRADGRWEARISLGGYGKSRRVKSLFAATQDRSD